MKRTQHGSARARRIHPSENTGTIRLRFQPEDALQHAQNVMMAVSRGGANPAEYIEVVVYHEPTAGGDFQVSVVGWTEEDSESGNQDRP
jgi:hypothetical protein